MPLSPAVQRLREQVYGYTPQESDDQSVEAQEAPQMPVTPAVDIQELRRRAFGVQAQPETAPATVAAPEVSAVEPTVAAQAPTPSPKLDLNALRTQAYGAVPAPQETPRQQLQESVQTVVGPSGEEEQLKFQELTPGPETAATRRSMRMRELAAKRREAKLREAEAGGEMVERDDVLKPYTIGTGETVAPETSSVTAQNMAGAVVSAQTDIPDTPRKRDPQLEHMDTLSTNARQFVDNWWDYIEVPVEFNEGSESSRAGGLVDYRDIVGVSDLTEEQQADLFQSVPVKEYKTDEEYRRMGKIGAVEAGRRSRESGEAWDLVPLVGGFHAAARTADMKMLIERLAEDDYDRDFFGMLEKKKDMARFGNMVESMREIQIRGYTFPAKLQSGAAQTLSFMAEIALTGGVGGATKKGGVKGLQAAMKSTLDDMIERGLWKSVGMKTLEATGRGLVLTVKNPGRVLQGSLERQMPREFALSDEGKLLITQVGDDPLKATVKAFGDLWIQNATEAAGELLLGPAAEAVNSKVRKALSSKVAGGSRMAVAAQKVVDAIATDWVGKGEGRSIAGFGKLVKNAGLGSILEEYTEEKLAQVLAGAFGVNVQPGDEPRNILQRIWDEFPKGQDALVEAILVSAFPTVARAGRAVVERFGGAAEAPVAEEAPTMAEEAPARPVEAVSEAAPTPEPAMAPEAPVAPETAPVEEAVPVTEQTTMEATRAEGVTPEGEPVMPEEGVDRGGVQQVPLRDVEQDREATAERVRGTQVGAEEAVAPEVTQAEQEQLDLFETPPPESKAVPPPPEARSPTSLKESVVAPEREARGMAPETKDDVLAFQEMRDKAEQTLKANPSAGRTLVNDLKAAPRSLNPEDVPILLMEKTSRINEQYEASAEAAAADASGDKARIDSAQRRLKAASDAVDEIYDVTARGRARGITMTARALNALKMMMDEEFDLVAIEQSVRAKQGGKPLTKQQKQKIAETKQQYEKANQELSAELERIQKERADLETQLAEAQANKAFDEAIRQKPIKKPVKASKRLTDIADKWESEARAELAKMGVQLTVGVDPARLYQLGKLGASYVLRGTAKLADVIDKMKQSFPGLDISEEDWKKVHASAVQQAYVELAKEEAPAKKQGKEKKARPPKGGGREAAIKALYRMQVENGVTDLDTATKNVHEIVSNVEPDVTLEQVRDTFSGYGITQEVTPDVVTKTLADMRAQAQKLASIERVQAKLAPLKSGPQRDKPSQTVRDLTKKLNRLMKEAGITTKTKEGQLASALDAVKSRLENSIADLTKAIATRTALQKRGPSIEYDEKAKALVRQRNELRDRYNELFPKEPITDEQRLKRAIKSAERSLAYQEQALKDAQNGIFTTVDPRPLPPSQRLDRIRAERDAAKAEVARLREIAEPGVAAVRAKRKRIEASIKQLQKRIREKDFGKQQRAEVDISNDPAAVAASMRLNTVRNQFYDLKEQARRAALSPVERAAEYGMATYDSTRSVLASFDISSLGRQGWPLVLAHPMIGLKSAGKMLKAMVSRQWSQTYSTQIEERANFKNGTYDKMKLAVSPTDGSGNFTEVEDRTRIDLINKAGEKVKVLKPVTEAIEGSNRAYGTYLNTLRADVADLMVKNAGGVENLSDEDLRAIGEGINNLSGRSAVSPRYAQAARRLFWAPGFIKAAFKLAVAAPLTSPSGTRASRLQFMRTYLRMGTSLAAIYALASMFRDPDDDEIVLDPRSSEFGAIDFGGVKFNPIGFVRPALVLLARQLTGVEVTSSGKRKIRSIWTWADEGAKDVSWNRDAKSVLGDFALSKFHPGLGAVLSALSGKEYDGTPFADSADAAKYLAASTLSPVAIRQVIELSRLSDPDAAVVFSLMALLGLDVRPDYNSPEYKELQQEKQKIRASSRSSRSRGRGR